MIAGVVNKRGNGKRDWFVPESMAGDTLGGFTTRRRFGNLPHKMGLFGGEGVTVMVFEGDAVKFEKGGRHFEEEKEGELFDVIAVGEAVVAEDIAVVPEFVDERGGG